MDPSNQRKPSEHFRRSTGDAEQGGDPTTHSVCPDASSHPAPPPASPPTKTLVLGLGNPLVTDDSVGLRVAEALKTRLADRPDVEVSEDYWGGLRLMERLIGYDRAIVVDAIQTGAPPGTIHWLTPDALPTQRSASAHDVNLPTALEFGRKAGMPLPLDRNIRLVGIEAADILTFAEQCTPAVAAAVPRAVAEVLDALESREGDKQP